MEEREKEIKEIQEASKPKVSFRSEDYMAVWFGLLLLAIGILIFFPNPPANLNANIEKHTAIMKAEQERAPFRTIAHLEADRALDKLRARDVEPGKTIGTYLRTTARWKDNPIDAFYLSEAEAERRAEAIKPKREAAIAKRDAAKKRAKEAEDIAAAAGFADPALNEAARAAIHEWSAITAPSLPKAYNYIPGYIILGIGMMLFWGIGNKIMGNSMGQYMRAFPVVFLLTIVAFTIGNQETMRGLGISYVLWAIFIGLAISNTIGTPRWLLPAVQTEFYIKTGLVLLGAAILISKIALIGIPGIFVTWVVTPPCASDNILVWSTHY
jgi:hypothetical protein